MVHNWKEFNHTDGPALDRSIACSNTCNSFGGGLCILQPPPRDFSRSRKRQRKACNHSKLVIENRDLEVGEILKVAGKDFVCSIIGLGTACKTGPRASTVV